MKRTLIINILFLLFLLPAAAQTKQQGLKREVTLYNPYKPSLADIRKRSFLPDIMDTSKVRPDFKYNIETVPYSPEYTISPIKAASLIPDPLAKLYKSYLKLGFGNYITPLAELSITNERSKKGAIGIIARHYSTNGKLKLDNDKRVFAGYMDNDVSLFGKRFLKGNYLEGSVDFMQKVRYAYGYDTSIAGYNPTKKEIRFPYQDAGARVSFGSLTLDSASFSYNFGLSYDLFFTSGNRYQHNVGLTGTMATMYKGFYAGADLEFQYYKPSTIIYSEGKYIASISPFLKKSTQQWSFKAGVQLLLDRNMTSAVFHLYPDARFSFAIVPSYVSFFAGLNGRLERNDPKHNIDINPYLVSDTLFKLVNTSNALAVSAGLKGNTGIGGNYLLSASYSIVNDMLFYTSAVYQLNVPTAMMGNTFIPLNDDGEIFTLHGEINGLINDKISYSGKTNLYKYTLSHFDRPWNMPLWDIKAGVAYNLRDKIIGNADLTIVGKRPLSATSSGIFEPNIPVADSPAHLNLNLGAEYRYTKILSFWVKLNNISYNRYYEWAWYPSQRFLFMAGFTYSL
jgi:hypothetical protein